MIMRSRDFAALAWICVLFGGGELLRDSVPILALILNILGALAIYTWWKGR